MSKIPTAEEILRKNVPTITFGKLIGSPVEQVISAMEEFAKLHVKAALEAAAKKAEIEENINGCRECGAWGVDEQSITDAYPETLIK